MASMEKDVQALADTLGLNTRELFEHAYHECHGWIHSVGPRTSFVAWQHADAPLPPFVLDFLKLRGIELLH